MLENKDFIPIVEKQLTKLGEKIISKAQQNEPENSDIKDLKPNVKVEGNTVELRFRGNIGIIYQDRGVSGTEVKYDTPYSYTNKFPNIAALDKWAEGKTMTLKGGKVRDLNSYVVAKKIYERGIEPKKFLTNAIKSSKDSIEMKTMVKSLSNKVRSEMAKEVKKTFKKSIKDSFNGNINIKVT